MRKKLIGLFFIVSSFAFMYLFVFVHPSYAAISDLPPYGTNVETWWNTFWANPLSSNYIPLGNVPSPSNTVTLSPGSNLQSAVDSLPQTGGTLLLQPGEYSGDIRIYGRNNIHVRGLGASPSDVVLTGTIWVAGCKEASYGYRPDGYDYFVGTLFQNNQYHIDCATKNRATNIYFYNFTMDAKGRMDPAQNWIELANGVVFDKIIWQGLTNDPTKVHWGHANGHVMEDNVWFRGNVFKGIYQTAVYMDGCHSCGVVESTIEANFYNSGLIFMDNNDLDYDYNKNGVFEDHELRNGRYLVTAYNNFVPSSNPSVVVTYDWFNYVVSYEGGNVLTLNNSVTANSNEFIYLKGACSYHSPVILDFYDLITKNNILKNSGTKFFLIEHSNQYCNYSVGGATTYNLGKYNVSNNVMTKASTGTSFATEISGPITGPNTVSNNCTGTACADPRQTIPNRTPSPSPSPTSVATSAPTPIPNVKTGDANNDGKVDMLDYNVWKNNYLVSGVMGYMYGDFDNNGRTDGVDYVKWLNNYDIPATPVPTIASTPRASTSPTTYFPYGIFEDGNSWGGSAKRTEMQSDLNKLKNLGITDIVYTNASPHLDITDSLGFSIMAAPMTELNSAWWNNSSAILTLDNAKSIAAPIIQSYSPHSSVKAYNLVDDADYYTAEKLALMSQAFNELEPNKPSAIMAPSESRFEAAQPPIYLNYIYPAMVTNNACDFSSKQMQSRYANNYAQAVQLSRDNLQIEKIGVPHWTVLQAHGYTSATNTAETDITKLRTPSVEEARLQNWISIGEGIDGISWFIYKTQQFWVGLDNNAPLLNEVSSLANRVKPLSGLLLQLKKANPQHFVATSTASLPSANRPYISTMQNKTNGKWYVVVANHSCNPQDISISTPYGSGTLKDVETNTSVQTGQAVNFRGGDGKIFEVTFPVNVPALTPSPNVVNNGSFESGSNGWSLPGGASIDSTVKRSGNNSLKFSTPANAYSVVPLSGTLKPNTQYSVSFWVKAQNLTGNGISMRYAHLSPSLGFSLTPLGMTWVNGTGDWKQVTTTFYTFEGLQSSRFDLLYNFTGGEAWLDDVVVCEGNLGCNGTFPIN